MATVENPYGHDEDRLCGTSGCHRCTAHDAWEECRELCSVAYWDEAVQAIIDGFHSDDAPSHPDDLLGFLLSFKKGDIIRTHGLKEEKK